MGIKDKVPLINSSSKSIRIVGYVFYAFVALIFIGAILPSPNENVSTSTEPPVPDDSESDVSSYGEYDVSSAGQTGQIEYATHEGTVRVNLPTGFYLVSKYSSNGGELGLYLGHIAAAKTAPGCVHVSNPPGGKYCPGHALDIMWGKLSNSGEDLNSWIDFERNYFGDNGSYTETASGNTAWMVFGNESSNGRYAAFVDYSDDKNKWLRVTVNPITSIGSPQQSMTPKEFKDFVESINIKI